MPKKGTQETKNFRAKSSKSRLRVRTLSSQEIDAEIQKFSASLGIQHEEHRRQVLIDPGIVLFSEYCPTLLSSELLVELDEIILSVETKIFNMVDALGSGEINPECGEILEKLNQLYGLRINALSTHENVVNFLDDLIRDYKNPDSRKNILLILDKLIDNPVFHAALTVDGQLARKFKIFNEEITNEFSSAVVNESFSRFLKIDFDQVVDDIFNKGSHSDNLDQYTAYLNRIGFSFQHELLSVSSSWARSMILERWVRLMDFAIKEGDGNIFASIRGALLQSAILRLLTADLNKLPTDIFSFSGILSGMSPRVREIFKKLFDDYPQRVDIARQLRQLARDKEDLIPYLPGLAGVLINLREEKKELHEVKGEEDRKGRNLERAFSEVQAYKGGGKIVQKKCQLSPSANQFSTQIQYHYNEVNKESISKREHKDDILLSMSLRARPRVVLLEPVEMPIWQSIGDADDAPIDLDTIHSEPGSVKEEIINKLRPLQPVSRRQWKAIYRENRVLLDFLRDHAGELHNPRFEQIEALFSTDQIITRITLDQQLREIGVTATQQELSEINRVNKHFYYLSQIINPAIRQLLDEKVDLSRNERLKTRGARPKALGYSTLDLIWQLNHTIFTSNSADGEKELVNCLKLLGLDRLTNTDIEKIKKYNKPTAMVDKASKQTALALYNEKSEKFRHQLTNASFVPFWLVAAVFGYSPGIALWNTANILRDKIDEAASFKEVSLEKISPKQHFFVTDQEVEEEIGEETGGVPLLSLSERKDSKTKKEAEDKIDENMPCVTFTLSTGKNAKLHHTCRFYHSYRPEAKIGYNRFRAISEEVVNENKVLFRQPTIKNHPIYDRRQDIFFSENGERKRITRREEKNLDETFSCDEFTDENIQRIVLLVLSVFMAHGQYNPHAKEGCRIKESVIDINLNIPLALDKQRNKIKDLFEERLKQAGIYSNQIHFNEAGLSSAPTSGPSFAA